MPNLSEIKIDTKKIIAIFLVIIFLVLWVFGIYKYINTKTLEEVNKTLSLIDSWVNFKSCENILENYHKISSNKYILNNKAISLKNYKESCLNRFSLNRQEINEDFCEHILKINDKNDLKEYIDTNWFEDIQKKCANNYLTLKFSTGSFFDIDNDFKSTLKIDLNHILFYNSWEKTDKQRLEDRTKAKQRLLSYFTINPKVDLTADDVVFYDNYALLSVKLLPETKYTIKSLLKIEQKDIDKWLERIKKTKNSQVKQNIFEFTTPKNKYLWIRLKNPVSLYLDKLPPSFKILDYDSEKKDVLVKICRVDNETFAKLDILRWRKVLQKEDKQLLTKGIDKLKTLECHTKKVDLRWEKDKEIFVKKEFNFDSEIWNPARSGLYFVTFADSSDRNFNNRLQKPILFWIVDAHITMKLSRNWEVYFFVNDFSWKPLANQNIRLYINNFKTKNRKWDSVNDKYVVTYNSVLKNNVLSKPIILWKTDKNWILKTNLKWKVESYFQKTFENKYNYKWSWIDDSFFITSASNTNLSYLKSTWNAWIAPENFWYKVAKTYWDENDKWDIPKLKMWDEIKPEFYSYTNTDRKLYLPWEEVYFKTILRYSNWLKIPANQKFNVIIKDSKNKEIYNKNLISNQYGSIFDKIKLNKSYPLWYYKIFISKWDKRVDYYTFAVEVFKNPKFKTDILLETSWLENWYAKITETKEKNYGYWVDKIYKWKFNIKARFSSKYYNWANLANADFTYKVYKQEYYENAWWDDCYYWCYWEPEKEFYTSWNWKLNSAWEAVVDIPVDFESSYWDYKYIVEVTVKDNIWDEISSSNSIIVKLPDEYKKYNPNFALKLESDKKFYKTWEQINITWKLNWWKWNKYFDGKYLLLVKQKTYENKQVEDVRWYKRTVVKPIEKLVDIIKLDSNNLKIDTDWNLKLTYKVSKPWEYVFEYSKINNNFKILDKNIDDLIDEFNSWEKQVKVKIQKEIYLSNWSINNILEKNPELKRQDIINSAKCSYYEESKAWWKTKVSLEKEQCLDREAKVEYEINIKADDLLDKQTLDFFTILAYWDKDASNPVVDDVKLRVFAEKNSYHIWEKARILVRLPVSKWKMLLTIEKQGVVKTELIPFNSNIFFKEFVVDDTFVPNAYIWVELIPEFDWKKVPEYKVWYTEIVVDKTDKKAFIDIKTDKKTYSPREKVNLDISVKNKSGVWVKSEVELMVVDDSLISLMWNIDLEVLKKFYSKLPFNIQTSITNIAMLKNYYFARVWIVWGSWYGNFKWWDSAVSSRNIFKNTAYYKANLVTDNNWNLKTSFTLPDNLTNFRIIVISNSKDNFFWVAQNNIQVRKNVVVEPKVPQILRYKDKVKLWINIFNNTDKKINFAVNLKADWLKIKNANKAITIAPNRSDILYFEVENTKKQWDINYEFAVLWDSVKNSDKIEWKIEVKTSPVLVSYDIKKASLDWNQEKSLKLDIWENVDLEQSKVILEFANTKLIWLKQLVKTLLTYPYGCIEQTTSSTIPNVVVKKFTSLFKYIDLDSKTIERNTEVWVERIKSMQTKDGGFAYWQGETESNLHITPYVLRSLVYMKKSGVKNLDDMINKATTYLQKHKNDTKVNRYSKEEWWVSDLEKAEIYWALAYAGKNEDIKIDLQKADRHTLLAYTYWLVLNKQDKNLINKNIEKIKSKLNDWETHAWYWNDLSDKAIFVKMLLDFNYSDKELINNLIDELYSINWNSYYYSTQAKNNAFMAFAKYLEKNNSNWVVNYSYTLWSTKDTANLNWYTKYKSKEYDLSKIVSGDIVNLDIKNNSKNKLYLSVTLKKYPKDITKIKAYSNKMTVSRQIYEVIDEEKLSKCNNALNSYYYEDIKVEDIEECKWVFKKKVDNIFKLWKKYRVVDTIKKADDNYERNITLEDYLPSAFTVLNTKFNTVSSSFKKNNNNWYFDHIENKPDVVFANASYIWWNKTSYTYYFTASFSWVFNYPPVTSYNMYNPKIRANTEFRRIIVK